MSGDERLNTRKTRASIKCEECNRYFINKEALESHKTLFHGTKKASAAVKSVPKTASNDQIINNNYSDNTSSPIVKLIKLENSTNSPVPKRVTQTAKKIIEAQKKSPVAQNGKTLSENEIITELEAKPVAVSFKNIGFKCPECAQNFQSYFTTVKHIENKHCMKNGKLDPDLKEELKPIRMGECVVCNQYFSLAQTHICPQNNKPKLAPKVYSATTSRTKASKEKVAVISIKHNDNNNDNRNEMASKTVKTYPSAKRSPKSLDLDGSNVRIDSTGINIDGTGIKINGKKKATGNKIETNVDPIALSEEDDLDNSKLMYVKKNSEFKCWGCHRTFINFEGFNSHVSQYHFDEAEIFFMNSLSEFNQLCVQIAAKSGANYKMLQLSSQRPDYYFLQCQSRPFIDNTGIAYYCPSSLILHKFGQIYHVAYCKKHFCHDDSVTTLKSVEPLIRKEVTDVYLQFRVMMESIIHEAAKVNKYKLNDLNKRAEELAKYLNKINVEKQENINSLRGVSIVQGPNLDEITVYKEDNKRKNKRITFSDDIQYGPAKRKRSSTLFEDRTRNESPVHETITTNVTIENHTPKIMNTFSLKTSPTISVKSVESLNRTFPDPFIASKKESFNDTYRDFLKSVNLSVNHNIKKIRTKLGQFSPKKNVAGKKSNAIKSRSKSIDEYETTKTKKTKLSQKQNVETPKANLNSQKTNSMLKTYLSSQKTNLSSSKTSLISQKSNVSSPKSILSTPKSSLSTPKSILSTPKSSSSTPKSSLSSPKTSEASPASSVSATKPSVPPVTASPKVLKYEVKERKNDCNILILKI